MPHLHFGSIRTDLQFVLDLSQGQSSLPFPSLPLRSSGWYTIFRVVASTTMWYRLRVTDPKLSSLRRFKAWVSLLWAQHLYHCTTIIVYTLLFKELESSVSSTLDLNCKIRTMWCISLVALYSYLCTTSSNSLDSLQRLKLNCINNSGFIKNN